MNFLSHFYFDRHSINCYHILGTVMPDLLKNADKSAVIHPEKLSHSNPEIQSIINGWKKHLEVDRHFHNSDFFKTHSHRLKLHLLPALAGSPVKPFFLGHIAVELILDNLLLTESLILADDFYNHLEGCEDDVIHEFLSFSGYTDSNLFLRFYTNFKKSRYLQSYIEVNQVAYALKRICMRIWNHPFSPEQEVQLNDLLADYRLRLKADFQSIYQEIERQLTA
ncbi:hypothetical protein GCM10027037_13930 [Mucilaginibacter koreensis]